MATIIEALDWLAAKSWLKEWRNPAWKEFVLTGDERQLARLPKFTGIAWLPAELLAALPTPDQLGEAGQRFLRACLAAGHPEALGKWMQKCAAQDGPGGELLQGACAQARAAGYSETSIATHVTQQVLPLVQPDGAPTPSGRHLLSCDDPVLHELARSLG